ncbi:hypothetical protein [Polaromonas jejuensis]|uniref:Lipoprotein n=1 Tax=Polaromonas jejuensis TaxID=457502 RepID=A0ABW0Q7L3_9BURK|nr:hypothetical protein [Polaromonas jejuensis]
MYASRFKSAAALVLALSAVLALGACNKKMDDTTKAPSSTAPMSNPGTSGGAMGGSSTKAPTSPTGSTGSGSSTSAAPPATAGSGY